MSKQPNLSFQRITADEAAEQRLRVSKQFEEEHPVAAAAAAAAPTPARQPGRPRKKRELAAVDDTVADAPAAQKQRRETNTSWFASPFLPDVLQALRRHAYNAKRTVAWLQQHTPPEDPDRYKRLSDSTIRHWFEKGTHTLLPRFQSQLDLGIAAQRGVRPPKMTTAIEDEVKRTLLKLRETGLPVNSHVIRWTLQGVFRERDPSLLESLQLSQQWISYWVRTKLKWRWRSRTTAAGKLPHDWEEQGILMNKRVAALMEMHGVHPSLVVNLDQTGQNLVPASCWTYETEGSAEVRTLGAEDKRQITAVLASTLYGNMLPLQLVFAGKTPRCLPDETAASKVARVDITCSPNHWSSLETMQRWITAVLMPHADRCIREHQLDANAHIVLILDCWSVHRSEDFRFFLRDTAFGSRIHLVFVPANCTSKLQVADAALQRPFKAGVRRSFDKWAAEQLLQQISARNVIGLREHFGMVNMKRHILQWCIDSWEQLQQQKQIIAEGWYKCCTSLYDVNQREKRIAALSAVAKKEIDDKLVPEEDEAAAQVLDSNSDASGAENSGSEDLSDGSGEELDDAAALPAPARCSSRISKPPAAAAGSYLLNSQRIVLTEDSES